MLKESTTRNEKLSGTRNRIEKFTLANGKELTMMYVKKWYVNVNIYITNLYGYM